MEVLDLARWQFGITTVYHFILVPLTIGLAPLVAIMQTKWLRSKEEKWLKLSQFFGKILLINFALGVATGIVQEFQFGMNWSEYSRFVGDIFGAPLAFEALLAFFLESTFLGLWIFGRGRLSAKVHTLCIWMVAIGVNISALFILAANSFMQDPRGAVFNPETGRAELDGMGSFLKVVFSPTSMYAFIHTVSGAFLVAGTIIASIATWWMVRSVKKYNNEEESRTLWRSGARFGYVSMLIAGIILAGSGHFMAQHVTEAQPMKMAAAMAACQTEEGAEFAILHLSSDCDPSKTIHLPIPGLESFMATNHFSGPESKVLGMEELNKQFQEKFADKYGADQDYTPPLLTTFYSFRAMIFLGVFSAIVALGGLYLTRKNRIVTSSGFAKFALWTAPAPFLAASFGWIFTEIGRQPWVVYPSTTGSEGIMLLTKLGVSYTVSPFEVFASLVIFTLLYAALGVVWFWLLRRYTLEGLVPDKAEETSDEASKSLTFVY